MITLRILTKKSKLGFGTYANETIGRLIEAQRYRYLRHIYYNYEAIDFTDDIKEEIHITHPIKKPAVAPNLEALNNEEMMAKMPLKQKSHLIAQKKRGERMENLGRFMEKQISKGEMQSINQGKAPQRKW